ncbi:ATP-binding protein, partial [Candidatus Woesearchaeota archaeon]|nr:ATP-binding protein [Candidatus Woesearchaeota archaeon]
MDKIVILDEALINKIAAGEVVERPASVVKELIENSIDAGARKISVEAKEGGKSFIRVMDDGFGMSKKDAALSWQRHSTSKIHDADDLFNIATLGFRGEALASIVAVSEMTLT